MVNLAFPEKLKQLRISSNLTQKNFADKIGVSQSSVNYWEKGQRIPSIEAAAKISDFFGITIESLLDSSNKVKQQNPINMIMGSFYNKEDQITDIHFSTDDYTLDELNQIWQFAHFLKKQRNE